MQRERKTDWKTDRERHKQRVIAWSREFEKRDAVERKEKKVVF